MRWWTYQKERFPIFQHGPLVAAFSSCAVAYSSMLTGAPPVWQTFAIAFVTCLLFFLQLRIADEFKDAEEDATYRPHRAVPRGLVKLSELGVIFVIAAIIQLVIAWAYAPALVIVLVIAWAYLALMSVEFFARGWLKSRPVTYLWTHMLIMPIVDFYATACHWLPSGEKPWGGLVFFLAASFCNGLVIEIGRKLRQAGGEETGVPTYSKLWGQQTAAWVWFGCLLSTTVFAVIAASFVHFAVPVFIVLCLLLLWAFKHTRHAHRTPSKTFELISGVWTLALYLSLGIIPLITQPL
ncbi:UbiA family prenyltransferase [Verrucomicrobiaceae bacterium N1E253]|uniref:UbiA family prenyltransferase n=1 Tax=Oceaniferula marina TaxID=2748318 RepID=A0A851GB26_9BACT|nr:UbiA family prenyltransferase [Oceaniferula marina]NWK54162.1 UbiA family prenyltransferase [Oceaniferula marina]